MMEFESIVDVQMGAMLEGIERELEQRRQDILQEAQDEARGRLREARRHARRLMAAAIAGEKDQWYLSLGRASAALASRLRNRQQALDREQLEAGESELRQALLARWQDPDARREWATALCEDATALLEPRGWQISYPDSLSDTEAQELLAAAAGVESLALEASAELEAGFKLRCGNACLDMSIDGLLAQPGEVAGALLAEIRRQQQAEAGE